MGRDQESPKSCLYMEIAFQWGLVAPPSLEAVVQSYLKYIKTTKYNCRATVLRAYMCAPKSSRGEWARPRGRSPRGRVGSSGPGAGPGAGAPSGRGPSATARRVPGKPTRVKPWKMGHWVAAMRLHNGALLGFKRVAMCQTFCAVVCVHFKFVDSLNN